MQGTTTLYFVYQLLNFKSENTLIVESTYLPAHSFQFRTHDIEIRLHPRNFHYSLHQQINSPRGQISSTLLAYMS